jgi:hypothetical protein
MSGLDLVRSGRLGVLGRELHARLRERQRVHRYLWSIVQRELWGRLAL